MEFTQLEREKLYRETLMPGCHYYDGKYICRLMVNGKQSNGGRFKTIKACNKRWRELTGEE